MSTTGRGASRQPPPPSSSTRIGVFGLGNVLMADDALGPTVIGLLAARYDFPENVRLVDLGTPGLDLHPHLRDLDAAILVDTVRSNGDPGEVRLYRRDEILRHAPMPRIGPHDPGLKEALLALEFAGEGPGELLLVGVIPESTTGGIGLSPPVESALASVEFSVLAELARLGAAPRASTTPREADLWWEARPAPLPAAP